MNYQEDFEIPLCPGVELNCYQQTLDALLREPIVSLIQDQASNKEEFGQQIKDNSEVMEFSIDASNIQSHRDCLTLDKDLSTSIAESRTVKKRRRLKAEEDFEFSEESVGDSLGMNKLERNRICARECRRRKKIYVKSLEQQIKSLKNELIECRRELSSYKYEEQKKCFDQLNMESILPDNPTLADKQMANSKRLITKYIV